MALDNQATLAVQKETVRKVIPLLINQDKRLYNKIGKGTDVLQVSTRAMRGPLLHQLPSDFSYNGLDGAGLGTGTGSDYNYFQITPLGVLLAIQSTALARYATDREEKAVEKPVQKEAARGLEEFLNAIDCQLQTAGNGVMATVSSVAGNTITLSATPFGARLLRKGASYQIMNAAQTVYRGLMKCLDLNSKLGQTQTVTVDGVPGGTIATDVIVSKGLAGANPVGLYGVPYFQTSTTTGTVMGVSRALSYMQSFIVNANGQALALGHLRLAYDGIVQNLGLEETGAKEGLFWYRNTSQRTSYEEIVSKVRRVPVSGSAKAVDMLEDEDEHTWMGIKTLTSIHADPTRIDLINRNAWMRAQWLDVDFYTMEDGTWLFPIVAADGSPTSSSVFYYAAGLQMAVDNLLSTASIVSLPQPAGYA